MSKKLGILYSQLREDEKALIEAARQQGVEPVLLKTEELIFDLQGDMVIAPGDIEVVLERGIDHFQALYSLLLLERAGVRTINSYDVARICGDKLLTTLAFQDAGVPTPRTEIAFSSDWAMQAVEDLGYPVMLKPLTGDKGALVARLNDYDAAKAVLEHKERLGQYDHSIYYLQEFLQNRPGRDIRVFVVGQEVVKAVYLIANKATSSSDENLTVIDCEITPEIKKVALAAASAVGGGVLAVDLIEDGDGPEGLSAIEVDYTVEFSKLGLAEELAPLIIQYALRDHE
ncbi:MAG TPA: RimK family alpha-L-glutamate ligase [Chloroflexia bacterium]|nr:RimK family alpha-L-glutamate ligase [Chloroflexia bacterium]